MTLAAGLTPSGFVAPTFAEIQADINTQILANVDAGLDLAPDQPIGQIVAIFAEQLAEAYEVVATVYGSYDPNSAEGRLLENIAAITGTVPQAATYSIAQATLGLSASTTVTAGAIAYVAGQPQNQWVLESTVTSTSAGNYPATFRSLNPGPVAAPAGTLTQIQTATVGWNSVTNALDAIPGDAADTDTTLRIKRAEELNGQGSGTVDAIRAAVAKVLGVNSVLVTENTSLFTAADGTPGKAFHVVVYAPTATNDDIAQAIWDNKPSGILAYGATTGTATDSQGNPQTVAFDVATDLPLYLVLTTTPNSLTTAQTNAVGQALVDWAEGTFDANGNELTAPNLVLGGNVIALAIRAAAIVPGVTSDVPTFTLGFAPSPVGTSNLTVSGTQIAILTLAGILINGVVPT